jgi:hypothetical protein
MTWRLLRIVIGAAVILAVVIWVVRVHAAAPVWMIRICDHAYARTVMCGLDTDERFATLKDCRASISVLARTVPELTMSCSRMVAA